MAPPAIFVTLALSAAAAFAQPPLVESEPEPAPVEAAEPMAESDALVEPAPAPPRPPATPEEIEATWQFAQAKLQSDQGDYEAAAESWRRTLELIPEEPYAHLEVSRFYGYLSQISRSPQRRQQYLERAVRAVEEAKRLADGNPDVLRAYGTMHLRLSDRRQESLVGARDAFEALRARGDADLQVLTSLGQIYLFRRESALAAEVLSEAATLAPSNRMVQSMLADALVATGDGEDAERALEVLVSIEPGSYEHRARLVELRARRGETEAALEALDEAPESLLADPRFQRLRARELHRAGRSAESLPILDELIESEVDSLANRRLRVAVYDALGDYENAAVEIETILDRERDEAKRREDRLVLSRAYENLGRWEEAADIYRELLTEHAASPEADAPNADGASEALKLQLALSRTLVRGGYEAEAFALLESLEQQSRGIQRFAVVETWTDLLGILGRHGEAADRLGATIDAVAEADTAGELERSLRLRQVLALARAARWQEVLDGVDGLLESADPPLRIALGQLRADALAGLDRTDEALAALDRAAAMPDLDSASTRRLQAARIEVLVAAERDPAADVALRDLATSADRDDRMLAARLYQQDDRYADALPLLEAIHQAEPDAIDVAFSLGSVYERLDRRAESIAIFQSILARDPDHLASLNYLGYMWAEAGERLDEAYSMISRAVASDPDNGAYVDSLGWVLHQLGRYEEAARHLEWASRLGPGDPTVLEHLGDTYRALGRTEDAIRTYEASIAAAAVAEEESSDAVREKLQALRDDEVAPAAVAAPGS